MVNKMDLTNIYRTFQPNITECSFSSAAHKLSPKMITKQDIKQVETHVGKSNSILHLFNHSGPKPDVNNNRAQRKHTNSRKLHYH